MDYEIVTEVIRTRLLGPVRASISVASLEEVVFRAEYYRSVLILYAANPDALGCLPGSRSGEAWLRFSSRDRLEAQELAATLKLAVAERGVRVLSGGGGEAVGRVTAGAQTPSLEWR
jgi:hypothetical protein